MNKKIYLFISSLEVGGAEKATVNLANGLYELGYEIELILTKKRGVYISEVSDEIKIVDLDSNSVLKSIISLARYLKKNKPEAIISAMGQCNVIAIISKMISFTDIKVIVTIHTNLNLNIDENYGFKSKVVSFLEKKYINMHKI